MTNIEINNTFFLIPDLDIIYNSYSDKTKSKEAYINTIEQFIIQSYRSSRWTEYKIQKYSDILTKINECDQMIIIESERDFYLLLRSLLNNRNKITKYPSLSFDTSVQLVQRFRVFQFLNVSIIQHADLTKEIIEIQKELVSLNSINTIDISLISQLKSTVLLNLKSLSIKVKYLSQDDIKNLNSFLTTCSLKTFSLKIDFAEETEDFEEELQKISIKLKVNKNIEQISFSSNCLEFFDLDDMFFFKRQEIFFIGDNIDFKGFENFKNINKIHFNIQKSLVMNHQLFQNTTYIVKENSQQIVELTINLQQLYYIMIEVQNLQLPLLYKLTIIENQQQIQEQDLLSFLLNFSNLMQVDVENYQLINQSLLLVLTNLYSLKTEQFKSFCYQTVQNNLIKQVSCQTYLYQLHPNYLYLFNEYQGSCLERENWIQHMILNFKHITNLRNINMNLHLNLVELTAQDQENIMNFVCQNKQIESIKIIFSQQNQNYGVYSILNKYIDQLTCLKEGSFGFNFLQEFRSYQEFKSIMNKCLQLKDLVSMCWILNGHGEEFEIFAIESLIEYHAITDLQIENHVKGAFCIEVFMDYIKNSDIQNQLWQKIKNMQIEQINYFFMKKIIKKPACLYLGYEFSQNQYIQNFTTSTYDCKLTQDETIDYFFYIFYSYRLSITIFNKYIFPIMSYNPFHIIFDLYE